MRIARTGKISEDFYAVGHAMTPVYLLDGASPVLFDAGYTAMTRLYLQDIKEILGRRAPEYLFITHAHFDHIGAASHFKDLWPEMQIVGSARSQEILNRPNAIRLIRDLNQEGLRIVRSWGVETLHEAPFEPFGLDLILSPGQALELGHGIHVKAIHTPGHTWDFMSYWVPEKKILVASEAVSCDYGDGFFIPEFLVDYDVYRRSIEMLSQLDFQILCQGHSLVFTEQDAREHLRNTLERSDEYVAMVEGFLRDEGADINRAVARVKAVEWDPKPAPKQPEKPYLINTQIRVKTIWERMKGKEG
ncbi:MAG: MBL fold metallo-hydrolase [Pseudomonadota bacterium]